ncbi:MAG TPA: hypothetical protein VEK76_05480 [Candidatus Binatia bacterium]|nr:hypothetical protein [Candidatus Binatia bacterium]
MVRPLGTAGRVPARVRIVIPILGALLGAGGAGAAMLPSPSLCASAAEAGHVALVVEHGDGSIVTRCVAFSGTSISGEEVLRKSGLGYGTASFSGLGDAVCQIDREPPAYTSCLPTTGDYWVLFSARPGGAWTEASTGISSQTFHSGDAEGFRYDPISGADPPPSQSPAGVCLAATSGTPGAAASTPSGVNPALVAGLVVAGALIVLAVAQLVLRRRHP